MQGCANLVVAVENSVVVERVDVGAVRAQIPLEPRKRKSRIEEGQKEKKK